MQILLLVLFAGACAALVVFSEKTRGPVSWILLFAGVAVFVIRTQHEGPYALPREGNLRAALLALLLGAGLARPWFGADRRAMIITRLALGLSPVIFFFALYSTLAELEEVVVLRATLASGETHDLRLWIVDFDGAAWVTMSGGKADANRLLAKTRAKLLRRGELHCVDASRVEEREAVNHVHTKRHEKYAVQRLATDLGIFGIEAQPGVIALRLDPCS